MRRKFFTVNKQNREILIDRTLFIQPGSTTYFDKKRALFSMHETITILLITYCKSHGEFC